MSVGHNLGRIFAVWVFSLLAASAAQAQATFNSTLSPTTITEGSVSTLTYDIGNGSGTPLVNGAFTTTLPAGVTFATPADLDVGTSCGGVTATAADGGTVLTVSDVAVGAFGSCSLSVLVTSSSVGSNIITSGDFTSDQGNSGTASSTLTVNATSSAPVFSKSLSDPSIAINGTTRMTYLIDNTANGNFVNGASFVENLPSGVTVAPTPNIDVSTCAFPPNVSASGGSISVTGITLLSGTTCSISLSLKATSAGTYTLLSGDLGTFSDSYGKSLASLSVTGLPTGTPQLQKFFPDGVANPGGTATLEFHISNGDRDFSATGITFTDDLDAMLSGATVVAASLPSDPCGTGSTLSGSSVLTFSGGTLAPGSNCSFSIQVNVPGGTTGGLYANTTGALTGSLGGTGFTGNQASDTLEVANATIDQPTFTLEFTDDPVLPGNTFNARYTITNASTTTTVTDLAFAHDISFTSAMVAGGTGSNLCGSGSFVFVNSVSGTPFLNLAGGQLAASASCVIDVTFQTDISETIGDYPTTTGPLSYNNGASVVSGPTASDTLTVEGGADLTLSKLFGQDNAQPGETVSLTFTISSAAESVSAATAIAFTDDLHAFHAGSTFAGLTSNTCGGTGAGATSDPSGAAVVDGTFSYSGGTLAPDNSCTIVIDVTLGAGDPGAEVTNTSSTLTATAGGAATTAPAATDTLFIGTVEPYQLAFAFDTSSALPGDLIGLDVTITNPNAPGTGDATSISLTSSLSAGLSGLAAEAPLPTDPCGPGSSLSGSNFVIMTGGNVAGGASCSFTIPVRVPAAAADGSYGVTAQSSGNVGGVTVSVNGAATLVIDSNLLSLTKSFAASTVTAGDTVDISIEVTNASATHTVTDIALTDDIGAMLSGATILSHATNCGSTAASTATVLDLSAGTLAPGATCTITATVQTPANAPAGDVTNTTSAVTGVVGSAAVTGASASGTFTLVPDIDLIFAKDLTPLAAPASGTTSLTITIENASPTATASNVGFTDDLDAMLSGTLAGGLSASSACGGGTFTGTSFLRFSGGNIAAGDTCTLTATISLPGSATPGVYTNTTSQLFIAGVASEPAVSDTLTIVPAPGFAKVFADATIALDQTSTLTFTVDNTASIIDATSLSFTDNLPAGVRVAATPNASTTCTGGSLTATGGSGVISYTGGTVTAAASCTVAVDVTGSALGSHVNTTGDLTSSLGNSGTASDTLTVEPQPTFAKAFGASTIGVNQTTSLTFTVDNSGATLTASALDFTDNLPAGLQVAATPNASTTCTGGSLTATGGTGVISYTGGTVTAAASCTVVVDVTPTTTGAKVNTSGDLTSSLGNSGTATDTLTVVPQPAFTKAFAVDPIGVGLVTSLSFDIDNSGSSIAATGLDFTDNLPAGMIVATPANITNLCTGGTVTATAGSGTISYSGGSIGAGANCLISVDVTTTATGGLTNTTGDLTSSLGNSGTASKTLTVVPQPTFTKSFADSAIPLGFSTTLTLRIDNSASSGAAVDVAFTDTLPAGLQIATPANASTSCASATLTAPAGGSAISLSDGFMNGGTSCVVEVDVTGTALGSHVNTTGDLTSSLGNSGTASDTLVVEPQPGFAKAFADAAIAQGFDTTLTFSIDNSGATLTASALDFTDTLPAGLQVAATPNAATTCTGGALTATGGAGTLSYTGGSLTGGGTCTVAVDVTGTATGALTNTSGDLTSSMGNSGTASDNITVVPQPGFAKAFAPAGINLGQSSTLTFTVDNTGSILAATALDFSDTLPANLAVAATPNASTTCTGGTLTATGGAGSIGYTGGSLAASSSCTVSVDVTPTAAGALDNLSGDLTSSLGNSGTAAATLTVITPEIGISGSVGGAVADGGTLDQGTPDAGAQQTLTLTISNTGTDALTLAAAPVITGATDVVVDSVTGPLATTVPIGGSTTVTILYTPAAAIQTDPTVSQPFSFDVSLGNNDVDESPYDFTVSGTAQDVTAPSGYTVAFDQNPVNIGNQGGIGFTFASAEVGAGFAYSITSSGGGAPVAGIGTIATATDQITGIDVSGLADGTLTLTVALTDPAGNTGADATATTAKDATAPAGYAATFDQDPVNAANQTAVSFTFAGAEIGSTYVYSITSTGGGAPVSTMGTIATATDQITGIDVSGLGDGTLTLSVTLTDTSGNTGATVTDTATKDATAPAGYAATFDQDPVNTANQTAVSYTFAAAEVGAGYAYSITSDGGGAPVTGTGTIATATDQITGIDVSGLGDGTLTLSVTLTDVAGNTGAAATDTTTKDATAPAGYTVAFDQDPVNAANQTAMSFTFAGAEVGAGYAYSIASDGGGVPVTGTGTIATITDVVSGLDLSGLGDGTLTLTVALTDVAGNTGTDATATVAKDTTAPAVAIDTPLSGDGFVNAAEAAGFVLSGTSTGMPDGSLVEISLSGNGVTFSGLTTTVTGGVWTLPFDMSFFPDGPIDVIAIGYDQANNPSPQATASGVLDTAAPTGYSVAFDQDPVNIANQTAIDITVSGAEVGATVALRISSDSGATIVTPATVTAATATVDVTGLDLSVLGDGTLTVTAILTDPAGNAGTAVTGTATKDTVAPGLTLDSPLAGDGVVNAAEAAAVTVSGTATDLADGTVVTVNVTDTGAGLATGTATVTGGLWSLTLDLSGLADGALSLTADASDAAGNPAPQATATASKDADVPVATIDGPIAGDDVINAAEAASFAVSGTATGVADGTIVRLILRDGASAAVYYREATVTAGAWSLTFDIAALADGSYDLSADVTDPAGNAATPATTALTKDTVAPSIQIADPAAGATSFFDNAVNAAEAAAFTASGTALNAADAVQVVLTATDGASGSVSVTTGLTAGPAPAHSWTEALDLTSLADGTITLTAVIIDTAGNTSSASTSFLKDTTAPAGYTATLDQDPVNIANATAASFTFAGAEVGPGAPGTDVTFAYSISSDGGGAPVTGTGTIATATDQVTGIDLSGLPDGTLTLSVTLTDFKGNTGAAATDTATKDATAPGLTFDSPLAGDDVVNGAEAAAVVISGTSTDLLDGATVTVAVSDAGAGLVTGSATVTGGVWSVTLDLSPLADGTLGLTADATDAAGNPAPQATAAMAKDTVAPTGYSASFDDDPVNAGNHTATGFTFAGAEVGASFAYAITSDGGGTAVTGTGTIATATDQIAGLDLSGLADGTLTLTVALTDPAGNTGADATDTATKDATLPTVAIDTPIAGDGVVNAAEALATPVSGTSTDLADGAVVSIVVSDGAAGSVTGTATVTGGVWTTTLDLSGLADGALALTADVSDAAGNAAPQASASATKDATAPSGYSAAFDQDPVNTGNQTVASFTFAGAEVGAGYAFTITSDGGGTPVSGAGTIATASDQISGLDLTALTDGTLTLTVALTDPAGNTGVNATDTAVKDVAVPTATLAGPVTPQADPFTVTLTFSEAVTGLDLTSVALVNGTASALTGSGADYSFTVTPDHDGTVEIALDAGAAADIVGNLSTAATAITVTAELTGTPNPTPLPDADGDGVADILETGDRDGDGIPDDEDFDPQGYFYCEDDGRIIPGGGFTVSGPSGSNSSLGTLNDINITRDGSTGEIQWFALRPGTYSMSLSYPTAVGVPSTTRLSSGTLDLTSLLPSNPAVIGSSEFGATGFLADASAAANPAFYTGFVIEPGDPFVLSNNIPMTQCAENLVTLSATTDGAEANTGVPTDATFTVTQGRASTVDTVIAYTVAGSATSGTDFTALSGTVTIPAGATSATITVPVLEDGDIEGPETVEITLTGVTSGDLTTLLGTAVTASATIADDDFADIAVVNVDLVTNEGGGDDATMTFALLGMPTSPVTLRFAGDSQCTVAPASITFTAADYAVPQALTIRAIDDDKVEGTHSCQPTVVVSSADTRYDGAPLALATVTVTDDLVDQIREPLTEILEDDLEETITAQTKAFSRMSKGALQRLQAGRDLPCGTIQGFDVDGSVQIQDATGAAQGTFGRDAYNCVTDTREILDGTFSLNKTEDTGVQALFQFAWQRERFISDAEIAGYFMGGYYSRTDVSGLGDGKIDGFGVNGGLYGARSFAQGLFLDYYLAGAAGRHRFDIDFDAAAAPINATGQYSYLAGFAGVGISGQREFDSFVMKPRVGLDLSYAKAGDADVTATQLGLSHNGVIDLDDFSGVRATAEIRFESLSAPGGAEALSGMMRTAFTPRFTCELSSYDDEANCGLGLAFAWERTDAASGLTWGFEVDMEQIDDSRRFTFNITRERPVANGRGAVVTRLSMPEAQTLELEHGLKLDF
ncbi:Ig-like domain-containing protein [Antarctobacter sp.]|uniref:DUF7933 domain-containing protein n=1 Tax=Antarctobacter sp. TaxID=1872577 RepID=UPI003A916035